MARTWAALAGVILTAACATPGGHGSGEGPDARGAPIDPQARAQVAHQDMLTQMSFWAREYEAHPDDLEAAQKFSEALRKGGSHARASEVALAALQQHQGDNTLLMTYGRALLAGGRAQEALRPLALVAASDAQDWRSRSALGAALDKLGRFEEARRAYDEALAIVPDEPSVLTNLGVSQLMRGQSAEAEATLRRAIVNPSAPPEARQNLAIAVGLQGRFDEAEQIARSDLPPALAAQNIAYLRSLVSDDRRWGDMGARAMR